ncbi:MAG TPA: Rrf2 family transcriptional regulator [Candidatus Brocadiia bacterium]|nr:Rrf2 family transcriptional regulator [Candidatus Brocadiia bacterium]
MITHKCQYAVRAVFELAKRYGEGTIKVAEVAEVQAIPPRFLEVILSQLKQGRFVDSRRGAGGGYYLVKNPKDITVGEIIEFVQGPIDPVGCTNEDDEKHCELLNNCPFKKMWNKARESLRGVYFTTTFQDLIDEYDESDVVQEYAI